MKNITITVILILGVFIVQAQEEQELKSSVRIGLNGAFFGSGDKSGIAISAEYAYPINRYLAVVPKISSGGGHGKSGPNYDLGTSFATSLSARLTPFPAKIKWLKIDIGGLYHNLVDSYGHMDFDNVISYASYRPKDLWGLIGTLNMNFYETEKLDIGFRFELLTSFSDGYLNSDAVQSGFYVGIKL